MLPIVSNTLAVFADGANTEIEVWAPYAALAVGGSLPIYTIRPSQFANQRVLLPHDFATYALYPPTGTTDGAQSNLWLVNTAASQCIVQVDASYVIPSTSRFGGNIAINPGTKTRFSSQYDSTRGAWEITMLMTGF